MRRAIILFLFILPVKANCQLTIGDVINRSKQYYAGLHSGSCKLMIIFKSAIAESSDTAHSDFSFCRDKDYYRTITDSTDKILTQQQYFLVDHKNKKYLDFTKYRQQGLAYFGKFPQFNRNFFDSIDTTGLRMELSNGLYHVYINSYHLFFDTTNCSIVRYRNMA